MNDLPAVRNIRLWIDAGDRQVTVSWREWERFCSFVKKWNETVQVKWDRQGEARAMRKKG